MIFSLSKQNRGLFCLSLVALIGSTSLPFDAHASSEITEKLEEHNISVAARSDQSRNADFYEEDIRAHLEGSPNEKLKKVLSNIDSLIESQMYRIDKKNLIEMLKSLNPDYKKSFGNWSKDIYFIPTKDLQEALKILKKSKMKKMEIEYRYEVEIPRKAKKAFIFENEVTPQELNEVKSIWG